MKRMLNLSSLIGLVLALSLLAPLAAPSMAPAGQAPTILWYNGDFDQGSAVLNGQNMNLYFYPAYTYDDFIVPTGTSWNITTVWSNNLMDTTGITSAYWEIRSGVSSGNKGNLVDSGTSAATQSPTGFTGFGFNEYSIQAGVNVNLGAGTYWLMVAPIGSGTGYSYISTTIGANAVGKPPGDDGNSFLNQPNFGAPAYFVPGSSGDYGTGYSPADFSMGVGGSAVPVPPTVWLLGSGLVGLWSLRRKLKARG